MAKKRVKMYKILIEDPHLVHLGDHQQIRTPLESGGKVAKW
jgi:hypothetical protein